jgi:RND family efflux transporter MFP subunit
VRDTSVRTAIDASGVAEPLRQAMLSTKLMGTVTAVLVHEGDVVREGQVLVRLDARELTAKAAQVQASIADAAAAQADAARQAGRMSALYADSAATRAQFDAAQTGLARADAGLRAAHAASRELDAVSTYATIRAPFAGVVTSRLADPGTFAAPGAPLVTVQDVSTLRIRVSAAAEAVRQIKRGQSVDATIDGVAASAIVEGIVPSASGNLFTVNATVSNRSNTYRGGSAAVLSLPSGIERAVLIPTAALVHDGDLTGVIIRDLRGDARRWIRVGATRGAFVIVTSGLRAGETIVVPPAAPSQPGA